MTFPRPQDSENPVTHYTRRSLLKGAAATLAAAAILEGSDLTALQALAQNAANPATKGKINQTVCEWCYGGLVKKLGKDGFYGLVAKLGYKGVDLAGAGDFALLKKHNLICSMLNSHGIGEGFNRKQNHEKCLAAVRKGIEAAAAAGFPNVICFSGNRAGMADDEGAKNCIEGLKQIAAFAEEKKITVCMEILNSKRDHKDYMCDTPEFGAQVCKGVGSERVKLLYDIYHVQVQQGEVIPTIKMFHDCIGHYHTAGVPADKKASFRNEIDVSPAQEINYPEVMKLIAETGFKGYVGQEFIPKRDAEKSLDEAFKICDI